MRVHEYLRILVVENKIVDYEYFMDDITDWEISMLLSMAIGVNRNDWEIARYLAYHNAVMSGNLKKQYAQKSMTELFPLPFDDNYKTSEKVEHNYEISNKEVEVMTVRTNKMAERFKNKFKKK